MKFLLENEKINIVPESDDDNHFVEQETSDIDIDNDEEYVRNEFKKTADFLVKSGNKASFDVYASGDTIQADFDFEFTKPEALNKVQSIVDDLRNCGDISLFMISFTFSDGSEKSIHDEYDYENFYTRKQIVQCSVSFLFLTEEAYDFNFDDYLDESLGLVEKSTENEALEKAQTEQEKKEIEKEIEEVDAKIDYADDHGMSKDHLIDEIDALNESVESYIYLFPQLTYEDKEQLDNYNLILLGKNRFEDEVNSVVKGSKEDLEFYAKDYLAYELHPDYLYVESDFAGEVEPDIFEDFDINGDVDFSIETPNKLTIDEIKEIAMEHYEDGGDVVIETMTDEDIQNWIESDGTLDGLMNMFRDNLSIYQDRKAREYDDAHYVPEIEQPEEVTEDEVDIWDDEDPMLPDEYEHDDDISDFGPGNPWDAPGMSVKDFLR